MFEEETVFVLGAGASCHYGFPLGNQLINNIINEMEDFIYLPIDFSELKRFYFSELDGQERFYPTEWLKRSLPFHSDHDESNCNRYKPVRLKYTLPTEVDTIKKEVSIEIEEKTSTSSTGSRICSASMPYLQEYSNNPGIMVKDIISKFLSKETSPLYDMIPLEESNNTTPLYLRNSNLFLKTKINTILDFKLLNQVLKDFNATSIDAFLRDNPSLAAPAKSMIIYSLLKKESTKKFETLLTKYSMHKNSLDNNDWYPFLLNDLMSGCGVKTPERLIENKLSIVTFNYDISLDHCIKEKLNKVEKFQENDIAEEYIKQLDINHVYGSLHLENREAYGYYIPPPYDENMKENFLRLHTAYTQHQAIKTMEEERQEDQAEHQKTLKKIRENIKNAKQIIFIGFAFDRSNLDQLDLPDNLEDWKIFCSNKQIKWLNYNNSMKGLSADFSKIDPTRQHIIESTASNIVDAYQNDFKTSLFKTSTFHKKKRSTKSEAVTEKETDCEIS